jgi:hypothetical protein
VKDATCLQVTVLGRPFNSIRLTPTAIAPEETSTTRWLCFFNWTTVSTIEERSESSGCWVVSWMMDDEPVLRVG